MVMTAVDVAASVTEAAGVVAPAAPPAEAANVTSCLLDRLPESLQVAVAAFLDLRSLWRLARCNSALRTLLLGSRHLWLPRLATSLRVVGLATEAAGTSSTTFAAESAAAAAAAARAAAARRCICCGIPGDDDLATVPELVSRLEAWSMEVGGAGVLSASGQEPPRPVIELGTSTKRVSDSDFAQGAGRCACRGKAICVAPPLHEDVKYTAVLLRTGACGVILQSTKSAAVEFVALDDGCARRCGDGAHDGWTSADGSPRRYRLSGEFPGLLVPVPGTDLVLFRKNSDAYETSLFRFDIDAKDLLPVAPDPFTRCFAGFERWPEPVAAVPSFDGSPWVWFDSLGRDPRRLVAFKAVPVMSEDGRIASHDMVFVNSIDASKFQYNEFWSFDAYGAGMVALSTEPNVMLNMPDAHHRVRVVRAIDEKVICDLSRPLLANPRFVGTRLLLTTVEIAGDSFLETIDLVAAASQADETTEHRSLEGFLFDVTLIKADYAHVALDPLAVSSDVFGYVVYFDPWRRKFVNFRTAERWPGKVCVQILYRGCDEDDSRALIAHCVYLDIDPFVWV
ncbi:hypothetical protein HK405_003238 [Cladochytrium tenue]|nr:hypothetical protein HK405_003238 [Cladochytrium tenue]